MLLSSPRAVAVLLLGLCGVTAPVAAQDQAASLEELLQARRYEEVLPMVEEREAEWRAEVARDDSFDNRMDWAQSLLLLGMIEHRLNKFRPALRHLRLARNLAIEADAGPYTIGDNLDALGQAEHGAGEYAEAEASLLAALEQRRKLPHGEQVPLISITKDNLGLLYLTMGRYEEAGRIFHETLAAAVDEDDPELLAQRHSYLGKYFHTMRSYATACEHFERALELATEALGEDHRTVISITGSLGLSYFRLAASDPRLLARAGELLSRAADLARAQPPSHEIALELSIYLNNLGHLALLEQEDEKALQIFTDSLETMTSRLGDSSAVLAPFYNNIGYAHQLLGQFPEAQNAYHQAAVRYRYSVGTNHQRYIEAQLNLVESLVLAAGPTEESSRQVAEVTTNALSMFNDAIAFGTERQRLNFLQRVDLISLPCSLGNDPVLIANTVLRTKGMLLDSLLTEQAEAGELLEKLRAKQRQLDDLLFNFKERGELQELRDEITALEAELRENQATQEGGEEISELDWSAVQATLPERTAFVDYVRYRNYQAGPSGPHSYGAVLLLPSGPPQWIPLGTEKKLNTWLGVLKDRLDYRAFLLGSKTSLPPPPLRLRTALRQLHDLFWSPIARYLPAGTETVGISPDAKLNFLSFAVLLDDQDRFLADGFRQVVYASSARELLVDETRPALRDGPWAVVAVPDFEASPSGTTPSNALDRVVLDTIEGFPAVPGAREELKRLHRIIPPEARGIELTNATEPDLRKLTESPVVLHLSTHAFFLPTGGQRESSEVQDFDHQPDGLYRSGLVLTEAKRALAERARGNPVPVERDGVLFSDEATNLPLHNTRLVTLSSCESGLGESVSGEGVYGLRRGFTLAGATNILISLWPVSDNSTPEFMERLYLLALDTDHLGQSLWETQRRTLQKIDPTDDAELEEAVLRYGCFVLCQRGPLQSAVAMPELKKPFNPWWIVVAIGVTCLLAFVLVRMMQSDRR